MATKINNRSSDIGIVVVSYHPNIDELEKNISEYHQCANELIIVDNSDDNVSFDRIKKLFNVEIIKLNENKGIAYAQNVGIERLVKNKDNKYILFFDQDSFLTSEQITELKKIYTEQERNKKNIGLVGPTIKTKQNSIESVNETLSSGSLIKIKVLKDVGLMNENLFIDLVDYEWCWRAIKKNYVIVRANNILLEHQLGEGRFFLIGIPQPIRHYYQFRNTIYLLNKSYVPFRFKIKYSVLLPIKFLVYVLFFKDRKQRLSYMYAGIKDGFKNRMGRI
ncbi:glycosyltransferase family 2 protein [Carnobacterium divergens]|uniref:glycosyltransferase family 2 protein n=1 Tax=Carnobacterium divergens TaxID=2748 RepID=UPI0039AF3229